MTTPARSRTSAGLLMFRQRDGVLEFLLVHPGGPLWSNRDDGAWSIPKGEAAEGEDLLERARKEFEEELGLAAPAKCFPLGSIKQKGGKTVHAWAAEGDLPADFQCSSNTFEMEWPPRSAKRQSFPEIDRAEFFPEAIARRKINPAQALLIDRLRAVLEQSA